MKMPVFIVCRDRLECLKQLVDWFEHAEGVERIVFLEHESTYPPLLEYYEKTPHEVVRLKNFAQEEVPTARRLSLEWGHEFYCLTDPDVIPREDCPRDALAHLAEGLKEFRWLTAGLGLEIGDLPERYTCRLLAVEAEVAYWLRPISPEWFIAQVDSTFAVSWANHEREFMAAESGHALRSNYPYVARHQTWYLDLAHPENWPDDERWYHERSEHKGWFVNWPWRAAEWEPAAHLLPEQIEQACVILERLSSKWTDGERGMCANVVARVRSKIR